MFINRGNHNNLLHYSNLTDNVAFKIIKYILLVTSLILLLIYVVLYIVFMLFTVKFIEQFYNDAKQLQRENIVADARLSVSIVFVGIVGIQTGLIYAIYRERNRGITLFAVFSLITSLSMLKSQGLFFSFGHFLIAFLYSILLFYYAYCIRRLRTANVLYTANAGPQDGLMFTNYGAPQLAYDQRAKPFRTRLFGSNRRAFASQPYSTYQPTFVANSNYQGVKLDSTQMHPFVNQPGLIDQSAFPMAASSMYPVQPANAALVGPSLQSHNSLYNSSRYPYQSASLQPGLQTASYQQLATTSQSAYGHTNAYPTVLNQGNASGYQHISSGTPATAIDRYNAYGNRAVSRQTPQIQIGSAYQRGYYDSTGYASNLLNAAQQRSWNVNVNPVADYVQPTNLIGPTTTARTTDPIYVGRTDANAPYHNQPNNYMPMARR